MFDKTDVHVGGSSTVVKAPDLSEVESTKSILAATRRITVGDWVEFNNKRAIVCESDGQIPATISITTLQRYKEYRPDEGRWGWLPDTDPSDYTDVVVLPLGYSISDDHRLIWRIHVKK